VEVERLAGDRVTLRAWTHADADWYVEARDDVVYRFTTERPDLTSEEVREAIDRTRLSPSSVAFAIDDDGGTLIGSLAVDIDENSAEISYFVGPPGRHRGLATDAVCTVVRWLASCDIREVVAVVARENAASARVLERVGFVPAGPVEHPRLGPAVRWTTAPVREVEASG
jgi:[ribosomal protein S5]-alanine N-acetyltransferase